MSPGTFTVGVIGSDQYCHVSAVRELVHVLSQGPPCEILTRGRGRVDRAVLKEARRRGVHADSPRPAREAPEHHLIAQIDVLHAFWDGHSRGTQHAITLARTMGIPVRIHGLVQ
jgi:hypothetical protein